MIWISYVTRGKNCTGVTQDLNGNHARALYSKEIQFQSIYMLLFITADTNRVYILNSEQTNGCTAKDKSLRKSRKSQSSLISSKYRDCSRKWVRLKGIWFKQSRHLSDMMRIAVRAVTRIKSSPVYWVKYFDLQESLKCMILTYKNRIHNIFEIFLTFVFICL